MGSDLSDLTQTIQIMDFPCISSMLYNLKNANHSRSCARVKSFFGLRVNVARASLPHEISVVALIIFVLVMSDSRVS